MIRAVLDTNIFVSALINDTGAPAKLVLRWLKGQFEILISREIMTKNTKHFPRKSHQGVRIAKISEFLKELEKQFPT